MRAGRVERAGRVPARAEDAPSSSAPGRHRLRAAWALALAMLLGLLFTGMTALTLTLWATDLGYTETNPVVDLAFFALGAMVTAGLASQVRAAPVAGLQQSVLALAVLAVVGAVAGRVEPVVGAVVLFLAVAPLVVSHPDRARLLLLGENPSSALAALAVIAVVPASVYAAGMVAQARAAGPSCFLGQCARGDRYAEAAALAVGIVAVALLAAASPSGWRLAAWSAGAAAVVLGGASLAVPGEVGAVAGPWAVGVTVWGVAVVTVAQQHPTHRSDP